jgi:Protein of unknown function (DUF2934)
MKSSGDHDDAHTPKPANQTSSPRQATEPTPSEIAERAHQLWLEQGMPANTAEQNWMDAERELKAAFRSHSLVEKVDENAGSVQR